MVALKKYDFSGKEIGEIVFDDDKLQVSANMQMIKDYIVAIRNNARQWSACTKGRSEVNKTKKKPHRQKGLGRARQGSMASPQFKGGGVVFGPKPKFDQHVRINKKERRKVIKSLLATLIKEGNAHIISDSLPSYKTKTVAQFLNHLKVGGKRVLFLMDLQEDKKQEHDILIKSVKNIPKVQYLYLKDVNGYNLALCNDIIFTEGAIDKLNEMFEKVK